MLTSIVEHNFLSSCKFYSRFFYKFLPFFRLYLDYSASYLGVKIGVFFFFCWNSHLRKRYINLTEQTTSQCSQSLETIYTFFCIYFTSIKKSSLFHNPCQAYLNTILRLQGDEQHRSMNIR